MTGRQLSFGGSQECFAFLTSYVYSGYPEGGGHV